MIGVVTTLLRVYCSRAIRKKRHKASSVLAGAQRIEMIVLRRSMSAVRPERTCSGLANIVVDVDSEHDALSEPVRMIPAVEEARAVVLTMGTFLLRLTARVTLLI